MADARSSARFSVDQRSSARYSVEKTEDADAKTGYAALALSSMLTAVGGGVAVFQAHAVRKDDFYPFTVYLLDVMEQPAYIQYLVNGTFFSGLSLFLASFLASTGSILARPKLAKAGLVLSFIAAAFVMVGGIISLNFINGLNGDINTGAPTLEGPSRQLQDWSIAMYDRCCLWPNFVDRRNAAFLKYLKGEDIDVTLKEMLTCEDFYKSRDIDRTRLPGLVQACIGNRLHLQWFKVATTDWMCDILNSTEVDISSAEFQQISLSEFLDTETIVIASQATQPTYGCGGGKILAFQYQCYLWFQNTCRPVAVVLMVVGILSLLCTFFGAASLGLSSSNRDIDIDMSVVQAYMNRQSLRRDEMNQAALAGVSRPTRPEGQQLVQVAVPVDVDDKI